MSTRWRAPTSRRARCGSTRPTKPIAPAPATAAAVHRETSSRKPIRARSGEMPSPCAISSPALSASSTRAPASISTVPAIAASTAISRKAFQRARESEPSIQNITEREPSAESEEKMSRFVTAVSAYPTATPESNRRSEVTRPPLRAMTKTSSAAPSAPRKASSDCAYSPSAAPIPKRIAAAAPVEAPPETPRMYGSASMLRTIACSAAPLIARHAPTAAPISTLGTRTDQTIASAAGAAAPPVTGRPRWSLMTCTVVAGERGTGPMPTHSSRLSTRKMLRAARTRMPRRARERSPSGSRGSCRSPCSCRARCARRSRGSGGGAGTGGARARCAMAMAPPSRSLAQPYKYRGAEASRPADGQEWSWLWWTPGRWSEPRSCSRSWTKASASS